MCLFDINHPKNGPTLMRCWNNCRRKRLDQKRSLNEQNRSGNEEENAVASSPASWTLFMTPPIIILLFCIEARQEKARTPSASPGASPTPFRTSGRLRGVFMRFHHFSVPWSVGDVLQDVVASSSHIQAFSTTSVSVKYALN